MKTLQSRWDITSILLGVNVLVFLLMNTNSRLIPYLTLSPQGLFQYGYYHTLITHMFLHGGTTHLALNMVGLLHFGPPVERRLGSREFLAYYLITGALAGLLATLYYYYTGQLIFLLGASGALYGVILAFALFYPHQRLYLFWFFPLRAKTAVLLAALLAVVLQLRGGGRISHIAHLGGFLFGGLYCALRLKINPLKLFISKEEQ